MNNKDVVFMPRDATDVLLKLTDSESSNPHKGYPLYLPEVDQFWKRMRRGRMYTVLASTSHYKTGIMSYVARNIAMELVGHDLSPGMFKRSPALVFFCSWEDSVEKIVSSDICNSVMLDADDILDGKLTGGQLRKLRDASLLRNELPLVVIGHSEFRPNSRPNLSLTNVEAAIQEVCSITGLPPAAIFLDYLQRIRPEGGNTRRLQMANNVERIKDLTFKIAAPFIVGCQANRDPYYRDIKMPDRYDAMETSNIEQTSDGMIGLYMPKMDGFNPFEPELLDYRYNVGQNLYITEDLVLLKILKQKKGATGITFPLRVNFRRNELEVIVQN